ncbi:MAG: cytochrome c oxidase subunit 2A [Caldilineaceae bacterium]|nr:cytochrome c oxidase subunit 2A [Caldilineaceae bacterium]
MKQGPDTPQGTIALLLVYFLVILALWGNVYFTMVSRGIAQ